MKETRQLRETRKAELVETHNMALSISRLRSGFLDNRWKRALYHAVLMEASADEAQKIRIALELP